MLELKHPFDLLKQSSLPRRFSLIGDDGVDVYILGSSSANSVASILTGETPIGNVSYRCENGNETITVWVGLLSDISFKPFAVLWGDDQRTKEQAEAAYKNLTRLGI